MTKKSELISEMDEDLEKAYTHSNTAEESVMGRTIERVWDMHKRMKVIENHVAEIPEIKFMMKTISSAQSAMAQSAVSMAETFKKSEDRAEKMDIKYEQMSNTAAGKDQLPLSSFKWGLLFSQIPAIVMGLVVIFYTLFYTQQEITASINSIEVNQAKINKRLEQEELQQGMRNGN